MAVAEKKLWQGELHALVKRKQLEYDAWDLSVGHWNQGFCWQWGSDLPSLGSEKRKWT